MQRREKHTAWTWQECGAECRAMRAQGTTPDKHNSDEVLSKRAGKSRDMTVGRDRRIQDSIFKKFRVLS